MTIADIYKDAEKLINNLISRSATNKGHHLTGRLEASLDAKTFKKRGIDTMEGFAIAYAQYVNDGTRAEKASFKQFPFLLEYFKKRGLDEKEAGGAAAATIKVWMREGMSTKASKRFSEDGSRNRFVDDAFENDNGQINNFMIAGFNKVVEEHYRKEKSEKI